MSYMLLDLLAIRFCQLCDTARSSHKIVYFLVYFQYTKCIYRIFIQFWQFILLPKIVFRLYFCFSYGFLTFIWFLWRNICFLYFFNFLHLFCGLCLYDFPFTSESSMVMRNENVSYLRAWKYVAFKGIQIIDYYVFLKFIFLLKFRKQLQYLLKEGNFFINY